MHPSNCPSCNIPWYDTQTIYEHFLSRSYSPERALEAASYYGHTPESPKRFGINVIGVEIPEKYDGVSYWQCTSCKTYFDRFTGEVANPFPEEA